MQGFSETDRRGITGNIGEEQQGQKRRSEEFFSTSPPASPTFPAFPRVDSLVCDCYKTLKSEGGFLQPQRNLRPEFSLYSEE